MSPTQPATRLVATLIMLPLIVFVLAPRPGLAKTTTWTNQSPSDDLWSNPGNWDNGVPGFNDEVLFDPIGGTSTQDIAGLHLQDLFMGSYTGTLTLLYPPDFSGNVFLAGTVETGELAVAGSLDVAGTLTAPFSSIATGGDFAVDGDVYAPGASISVGGALTVSGVLDGTGATVFVVMNATVDGELYVGDFSLITIGSDLDVSGRLEAFDSVVEIGGAFTGHGGATLDLTNGNLEVEGNLDVSGASSCTWVGGILRFSGGGDQDWTSGPTTSEFGDVQVDVLGPSRVRLHGLGVNVDLNHLTLSQGTLELVSGDLVVRGNTLLSSNATLENTTNIGATHEFRGGVIVSGGTLRMTAAGCTLAFAAGSSGKVDVNGTGTFEAIGAPGDLIRLEQDGVYGGSQWNLEFDPQSTLTFDRVRVQDSNAQSGVVVAGESEDGGNNTNWDFGPKTTVWTGAGPSDNWSDFSNWSAGVPGPGDVVTFSAVGGSSVLDVGGLGLQSLDMGGFTGALDILQPLSVTVDASTSGDVLLVGGDLAVGGNLTVTGTMDASAATIATGGHLTAPGTLDASGATISVSGDATFGALLVGSGGLLDVDGQLRVDSSLNADLGGHIDVLGDISAGPGATLDMGNGTLVVRSTVDLSSASSMTWHPSGVLRLETGYDYDVSLGGATTLGTVRVLHPSPSVVATLHSPAPVHVSGSLEVVRGALELGNVQVEVDLDGLIELDGEVKGSYAPGAGIDIHGTLTVRGDFTYTHPDVTVNLHDANIEGEFRLIGDRSSLRVAPDFSLNVFSGASIDVSGGLGVDRSELVLDGSVHAGQWRLSLAPGSTSRFENVHVRDSDASSGETAGATGDSENGGNNENWNFESTAVGPILPTHLTLDVAPNPFNPKTVLHYTVPADGNVTIKIYDVRGVFVRSLFEGVRARGSYSVAWDGTDEVHQRVGSGSYFSRIELSAQGGVVRKLVLLK